jgi:hypothetical protein
MNVKFLKSELMESRPAQSVIQPEFGEAFDLEPALSQQVFSAVKNFIFVH